MNKSFLFLFCVSCATQSYSPGENVFLKDGNTAVVITKNSDQKYYIKSNVVSYADGYGIWRSKYQIVELDFILSKVR